MQSNYECEKASPNGTLRYSMNCTSSSSKEEFGGGHCFVAGLSTSISKEDMVNATCRVVNVQFPETTPPDTIPPMVFMSLVILVVTFFQVRSVYRLLHRWCSRRSLPGYPYDMVSRLKYQLAMECFAKYFLLATLVALLFLAALDYRLSCRLDDPYWTAVLLVSMAANAYTWLVIDDLKFFDELPDSVFESGHIDREKIKQIRKQKKDSRFGHYEERQLNCTVCRGNCRHCNRPLYRSGH
ncbi:hypothetical protein AAVH_16046 [Aphelenchoides avenae]|nr:hypothetical protein AAVH_16046 [Aphelenchus avenae]